MNDTTSLEIIMVSCDGRIISYIGGINDTTGLEMKMMTI